MCASSVASLDAREDCCQLLSSSFSLAREDLIHTETHGAIYRSETCKAVVGLGRRKRANCWLPKEYTGIVHAADLVGQEPSSLEGDSQSRPMHLSA